MNELRGGSCQFITQIPSGDLGIPKGSNRFVNYVIQGVAPLLFLVYYSTPNKLNQTPEQLHTIGIMRKLLASLTHGVTMKNTALIIVASTLLAACGGGSSSSSDTVKTPTTPEQPGTCLSTPTLTLNGQTYTLAELDKNNNGCIDSDEIPSPTDGNGTKEPTDPGDTVTDEEKTAVSSNLIDVALRDEGEDYPLLTTFEVTGNAELITAQGVAGVPDGAVIAQLHSNIDSGEFLVKLSVDNPEIRPSGAKALFFFSDTAASSFISNGGSTGNNWTISSQIDTLIVRCTYTSTSDVDCGGSTSDQSGKLGTTVPRVTRLVALLCVYDYCTSGGDVFVQLN